MSETPTPRRRCDNPDFLQMLNEIPLAIQALIKEAANLIDNGIHSETEADRLANLFDEVEQLASAAAADLEMSDPRPALELVFSDFSHDLADLRNAGFAYLYERVSDLMNIMGHSVEADEKSLRDRQVLKDPSNLRKLLRLLDENEEDE